MNTSVDFLKVLAAQFFLKSVIRTFYKLPSTYAYIDPFPIFNKFLIPLRISENLQLSFNYKQVQY